MSKLKKSYTPMGARLLVSEIITSLSLEERGARSNLTVIVENDNRPPSTTGRVEAIGSDPIFTAEDIRVGDTVFFGPHAGVNHTIEGHEFKMLEFQEITLVERERPTQQVEPKTTSAPQSTP